jgi:hypothetical protein
MLEIHDLEVILLTSSYVYHSVALSFKEINVGMVVFILFGMFAKRICKIVLIGFAMSVYM